MKNMCGKFSSSLRSFIINRSGYYYNPAQFQGFQSFYGDGKGYKCLHINSHDQRNKSPNAIISSGGNESLEQEGAVQNSVPGCLKCG